MIETYTKDKVFVRQFDKYRCRKCKCVIDSVRFKNLLIHIFDVSQERMKIILSDPDSAAYRESL